MAILGTTTLTTVAVEAEVYAWAMRAAVAAVV